MSDYQITCHKPDNADADRRLQGLGGPVCGYLGIDTIIYRIENHIDRYWTTANGVSVWIEVKVRSNGRKYLKTTADGYEPNNLLALPHCP